MTLKEIYDDWMLQKQRQVKKTTIAVYTNMWRTHIGPGWGDVEISDINKKTIRPWVYDKLDSDLSKKYVREILICIRLMLKHAREEMDIDVPSMDWNIVWPTENVTGTKRIETYPENVVQKVLSKSMEKPDSRTVALLIAFCSGMRIGEVCGLKWSDVDLEKKVFHVRRTVSRVYGGKIKGGELIIGTTKTVSGTRDIPIVKNIFPLIKKWKVFHDDEYYVASCKEKPYEPASFRHWSVRYLKSIGVNEVLRFHAIRHTFATRLIEAGVDVKSVSSIMGHSDISTTLDLYVHPSEDSKRKAVDKVFSKLF